MKRLLSIQYILLLIGIVLITSCGGSSSSGGSGGDTPPPKETPLPNQPTLKLEHKGQNQYQVTLFNSEEYKDKQLNSIPIMTVICKAILDENTQKLKIRSLQDQYTAEVSGGMSIKPSEGEVWFISFKFLSDSSQKRISEAVIPLYVVYCKATPEPKISKNTDIVIDYFETKTNEDPTADIKNIKNLE